MATSRRASPAVVDTWATALARFCTMSFSQVLQPPIELAAYGFPVYQRLHDSKECGVILGAVSPKGNIGYAIGW